MKKDRVKKEFFSELEKNGIVESACKKCGISRNSVYRWKKESIRFARKFEESRLIGESVINDFAEANILRDIQGGSIPSSKYWLDRRHPKFIPRYRGEVNKLNDYEKLVLRREEAAKKKVAVIKAKKFMDGWFKDPKKDR